jgi:adenylosuccinate synthase
MGVGQTVEYGHRHPDAPRAGDVRSPSRLRRRLAAVRDRLTALYGVLDGPPVDDVVAAFVAFGRAVSIVDSAYLRRLLGRGQCVFEGAQGVLLDEWRGWHPYTTWSTTTFDNVSALCDSFRRLGVVRAYSVIDRDGTGGAGRRRASARSLPCGGWCLRAIEDTLGAERTQCRR